jgi:hypothetical protein
MFKTLISYDNVEVGVHTYYAFRGALYGYTLFISVYKKMFKTSYDQSI